MEWGCAVPEALGSLGVKDARSVEPFRFAGHDWIAVNPKPQIRHPKP